jgi:hypothetical protein
VAQLQQSGVIGGYGDGTFRGDRTLTRYELASIVANINPELGKDNPNVKKLQSEFATELYNLGVRVDSLEKNASTIKFSGDARIRYQSHPALVPQNDDTEGRFQQRVRLYTEAGVNDNIVFKGRIRYDNENSNHIDNKSKTYEMMFDRAYFLWNNANTAVAVGRIEDGHGGINTIGQGLIWGGERSDGILAAYDNGKIKAAAGILDLANQGYPLASDTAAVNTVSTTVGHLGYTFSDKVELTAGYADAHGDAQFKTWSVGANAKFGKDFKLIGEYIENTDAPDGSDDKGTWARLQYKQAKMSDPGSYQVYAEYIKLGGEATLGYGLNQFDQSYDAAKGWGLGATYVVGKNHNVQLAYHKLKPYDGGQSYKDQWLFATNFAF